ncbi:hypothetical protein GALL_173550 [mine drainage metagenome]|uniref:Secretion system C-terminal sorting domain-containing protein n=1 Tax=mine drainage metagenome TaxID=410659 RepID=A0A1J5RXJ8_9ZZZZ
MKKIVFYILLIFIINTAKSQSISPLESAQYCPLTNITFTVTIPGSNPVVSSWTNGPIVVQQAQVLNNNTSNTSTTFTFIGQFRDVNISQVFKIDYTDANGLGATYLPTFKYIKSLFYNYPTGSSSSSPCQQFAANQASVIAPRCQIVNIPISVKAANWSTFGEGSDFCWGSISTYEYQLPAGWILNGTTSTGTNWIAGGGSVTITSNLSTGDGMTIKARPTNSCGTGLSNGITPAQILISRPAPTLSIPSASGSYTLCSGVTDNYTITGLTNGASVSWNINNNTNNLAQITAGGNTATVTVQANSLGYTGDITLVATVTDCMSTYTKTQTITIGTGSAPAITNLNVDNTCGTFAEAYCTNPPNSTGFIWTYNFGQVVQNNPGYYGDYFLLKPLGQTATGQTYYDYLSVQATNACGVSASSATSSFTIGPISSTCGSGGGGKGLLSIKPGNTKTLTDVINKESENVLKIYPNPANNNITVTTTAKEVGATLQIISNKGAVIYKTIIENNATNINIANYNSGMYYIKIISNSGIKTLKFVKQ